jgi:hypothetical protein
MNTVVITGSQAERDRTNHNTPLKTSDVLLLARYVSRSAQLDQYNLARTPDTRKMAPRNAQHGAVLNIS